MACPCETRTSTCRSFATISSGLYRFLAITVLLDAKDIPQVGLLQWGRITTARPPAGRPQCTNVANGTTRKSRDVRFCAAIRGVADIKRALSPRPDLWAHALGHWQLAVRGRALVELR